MAAAETARLIASLELDPRKFTQGADKALGKLGQVEGRFGKLGGMAAQGARNAAANVAKIGAVAAGAITLAVRGGIQSLAELEDATTSVQGAIDQVGDGWKTNAQTIATWANEIEASTQAAFDDKAITQAATTLIRYGKVSEENLRPSLVVMTDLAAKTGDVDSAAALLAKALADPEKAAGKLARTGIVLTKAQQDQIKAMVKAGDTAGAQAFLLRQLETATKGAAAASAGPYRDAMNTLSDVTEDVQRVLAEGFLPVLQRVAGELSKKVADPKFMGQVREFGKTLAGAFDKLLQIGGRIPWQQIGDSLKIAGAGGKALFDAFTAMPAWVQTAVLTGWGLNKLSGGMLGGIVGELGKGLIKGVLGMNAGVVNINAGVVNGGVSGAVGGAAKTGISALGKVFLVGEAIGLVLAVNEVRDSVSAGVTAQAQSLHQTLTQSLAGTNTVADLQQKLAGIDQGIARLKADPLAVALVTGPALDELEAMRSEVVAELQGIKKLNSSGSPDERRPASKRPLTGSVFTAEQTKANVKWSKISAATTETNAKLTRQQQKIDMVRAAAERTKSSVDWARASITGAERAGTAAVVAAIRANAPKTIVNVSLNGNVITRTYSTGETVNKAVRYDILNRTID